MTSRDETRIFEKQAKPKKLSKTAVKINNGIHSEESTEKFIKSCIAQFRKDDPNSFPKTEEIWFKLKASPVSLINIPKTVSPETGEVTEEINFIDSRAETEADNILAEYFPPDKGYNKEDFYDNKGARRNLVNSLKTLLNDSYQRENFSSRLKLNSGISYMHTNSEKLINALKGNDPLSGEKRYTREMKIKGVSESDINDERQKLFIKNKVIDFEVINVDYVSIPENFFGRTLNFFCDNPDKKKKRTKISKARFEETLEGTQWYSDLFMKIIKSIGNKIIGASNYNEIVREDGYSKVNSSGKEMTIKEESIYLAILEELDEIKIGMETGDYPKCPIRYDEETINLKKLMAIVEKYVTNIQHFFPTRINKLLFLSIIGNAEIYDKISKMTEGITKSFGFDKNLITRFYDYGFETAESYIDRISNFNMSGIDEDGFKFLSSFYRFYGKSFGPFDDSEVLTISENGRDSINIPESKIFNVEILVSTINSVLGQNVNYDNDFIQSIRVELAKKQIYVDEERKKIENEIDEKYGEITTQRVLKLPKATYSRTELNWIESSKKRIKRNIVKFVQESSGHSYDEDQKNFIFSELYDIIINKNLDHIPNYSYLSSNFSKEAFEAIRDLEEEKKLKWINDQMEVFEKKVRKEADENILIAIDYQRNEIRKEKEDILFAKQEKLEKEKKQLETEKKVETRKKFATLTNMSESDKSGSESESDNSDSESESDNSDSESESDNSDSESDDSDISEDDEEDSDNKDNKDNTNNEENKEDTDNKEDKDDKDDKENIFTRDEEKILPDYKYKIIEDEANECTTNVLNGQRKYLESEFYRLNRVRSTVKPIDDQCFINAKKEFDGIRGYIETVFTPTFEDYMFAAKEGIGVNMDFDITDNCYMAVTGETFKTYSKVMFSDVYYEPQEKNSNGMPNKSLEYRKPKLNGEEKIVSYFKKSFEIFSSIPTGFLITVGPKETDRGIKLYMTVKFPMQADVLLCSKFKTEFFSSEPDIIISGTGVRDIFQIDKKFIIKWKKETNQRNLLAGKNNEKTLDLIATSEALPQEFPFINGEWEYKIGPIITQFRNSRPRRRNPQQQDKGGRIGLPKPNDDSVEGPTFDFKSSEINRINVEKWGTYGNDRSLLSGRQNDPNKNKLVLDIKAGYGRKSSSNASGSQKMSTPVKNQNRQKFDRRENNSNSSQDARNNFSPFYKNSNVRNIYQPRNNSERITSKSSFRHLSNDDDEINEDDTNVEKLEKNIEGNVEFTEPEDQLKYDKNGNIIKEPEWKIVPNGTKKTKAKPIDKNNRKSTPNRIVRVNDSERDFGSQKSSNKRSINRSYNGSDRRSRNGSDNGSDRRSRNSSDRRSRNSSIRTDETGGKSFVRSGNVRSGRISNNNDNKRANSPHQVWNSSPQRSRASSPLRKTSQNSDPTMYDDTEKTVENVQNEHNSSNSSEPKRVKDIVVDEVDESEMYGF